MVLIRQTERERDNLLFAFSEKLVTWEEGSGNNSLRELKIPEPVLPENLTKGQIEVIQKETKNITWIELSKNGQYIAVTTENKQLVVLDKTFKTVKNILLSRMANKISFTPTNDLLVADRTGDVYLYKMEDEQNQPVLLLGHLSVILDMVVTDCGNYIITCDRDEKIRVSNFPNAYNIVTYCLGHTEFVMTLKVLKNKNILLSASGDGTIRIWDYLKGKQVNKIDTKELAEDEILKQFASQMDTEKVDVTTLPITDMQIYEDDENVIIVTSLYKMEKLHIYKMNSNSLDYTHCTNIDIGAQLFTFYLSPLKKFYIFDNSSNLLVFLFVENFELSYLCGGFLKKHLQKYKEFFNLGNDITLLYKRKFDNVQEYMERKRQRLDCK